MGLCFLSCFDSEERWDRMRCRAIEVPVMPEPMMTTSASVGGVEGVVEKAGWSGESQNEEVAGGEVVGMPGSERMRFVASDFAAVGIAGEESRLRINDIVVCRL
jgi:hypothetical protein